jgi:hypothetical protein
MNNVDIFHGISTRWIHLLGDGNYHDCYRASATYRNNDTPIEGLQSTPCNLKSLHQCCNPTMTATSKQRHLNFFFTSGGDA